MKSSTRKFKVGQAVREKGMRAEWKVSSIGGCSDKNLIAVVDAEGRDCGFYLPQQLEPVPAPIYCVSEFQRPATCDEGEDCNPAENPAHHVLIDLTPEARAVLIRAYKLLQAFEEGNGSPVAAHASVLELVDLLDRAEEK